MALCATTYSRELATKLLSRGFSSQGKEKIVILGVGWGGFRVARDLDKTKFDVTIVSPRNHFLFTPLLPSTTVGTLEFRYLLAMSNHNHICGANHRYCANVKAAWLVSRCVQEPARTIEGAHYHQAKATSINLKEKTVSCLDVYRHYESGDLSFDLPYDKLVIAVGAKSNTFGVPGIESREEELRTKEGATGTNKHNVFFLKDLRHAR